MTAPQLTQYVQGQGSVSADGLNTFQQTTNLVADLRAFVGVTGIQVYCRGQTTVNDGGGGIFYWNAFGTGPDDGVNTIVAVGAATGVWSRLAGTSAVLTFQVLGAGSGTYITPLGARQLRLRMVAGGGGGGGGGATGTNGDGTDGGFTAFAGIICVGGQHGLGNGNGGYNTIAGTGGVLYRALGTAGGCGVPSSPTVFAFGGTGAGSPFGGGGKAGGALGGGVPAQSATGGGGGGGGSNLVAGNGGGGGQAGEYAELVITGPASTYGYTVGLGGIGGTAGTAGAVGGPGGSGIIIVEQSF